uniref:CHD3-type chromatin-remodeling factor PICKLE n=1 Tax=Aegilops tauschii subsp. strangulata TaxID=200361 RepID=A0A453G7J6_AEGTS
GAATSELHEDEVQAADVMPSNGEDHRKAIPCRRMSKRLQEKQKADHVSDENCTEASLCILSTSKSSGSDDELLRSTVKLCKSASSGPTCSICKSGAGSCLLIQCQNTSCSRSFHTFCLSPLMQDSRGTLECPLCKIDQASLAKGTEVYALKKVQTLVGCRRVILQESDFQYQMLVKWHSLSHHHDCWVPLDWLRVFEPQRARAYISKNTLPKEAYLEDQRKPEWFEVDRAIACRRKFGYDGLCDVLASFDNNADFEGYEFLVKWKGLDYCDATWEPYFTEGVPSAVSMLVQRHKNTVRSPMNIDVMVPENALYNYQVQGLQWILDNFKSRRSVILADEMGLGKTVQVVCFLNRIIKGSLTTSPALVIVPKSILLQWEKEFDRWAHDLSIVVYQGDKDSRKCIQAHELYSSKGKTLFDALVTSYEIVQIDKAVLKKIKWSTIVIDEAHRLKTLDCNLASCLKKFSSDFWLLLTGTPFQNNVLELFSLLHYIDPNEFSDPKDDPLFSPIESERGLTIDEKIARIPEILKPRMLRRLKANVLKDSMPTKKWVEVPCALTDSQRDLYINILEKNYSELNSAIQDGTKRSLNNVLMELRKCCNHPYLFTGLDVKQHAGEDVLQSLVSASGKLQLLQKLLPKLKERGNRVLIFSQMKKMLDILEDFLSFLGYTYARIDGQTTLFERQESIKEYNNAESGTFIFLMSTRAGGIGIDLPGADRVIIYDPDFNPFMDLQAQSRAHRIGQTRPVVVYQLITKCSVEAKILQKSKQKLAIENILMNSSKKPPSADELKSILLHGAKIIQDKKEIKAVSIHYDDDAIENLLKLDPSSDEMCTKDGNGYLGGIESFPHGAEDVVPPSPKVEDLKVFKPATPKVDLGRGRRHRNVVKYFEETDNEDSDDIYAPEASSESSSSSSDDETDEEIPEVARARTEIDMKAETVSVVKPEVAPIPGNPFDFLRVRVRQLFLG